MRSWLAPALFVALCAGCVEVVDFDPVGDTASIVFTWTIDGRFPTTELCEAAGVSTVRIAFVDDGRPVVHGSLVRDCATCSESSPPSCFAERPCTRGGEVECFDTEDERVVASGDWTIRVEAVDDGGNVVQASPQAVYSSATGRIEVMPAAFFSSAVSATVTIDGEAPTTMSCSDLGIETIQLVFDEASGAIATEPIEACAVGGVGTRVEPGTYTVRLRALDVAGAPLAETAPETFTLGTGERAVLNGDEPVELTGL
jgi:hypothetical protein